MEEGGRASWEQDGRPTKGGPCGLGRDAVWGRTVEPELEPAWRGRLGLDWEGLSAIRRSWDFALEALGSSR